MKISSLFLVLILLVPLCAQPTRSFSAAEIQQRIERLDVLGSVLYIAAHPDDENTRVLAYMANHALMRTAYLSVTRGDGGQNLIGTEQGDLLGAIRTQELLAARRVDGAEQFFTRAVDFGYSKSPEEALQIWGKESILADVVWVIRRFRPDIILTRFTPERGGHGHHRASAILAEEAFTAAADPSRFPEQLEHVSPWQARRLMWDAWFWNVDRDTVDWSQFVTIDASAYLPLPGQSASEIAAVSRSMHKSQGFGASAQRMQFEEYFQHTAGERAVESLFDNIDTGWSRVEGSARVRELVNRIRTDYDPLRPDAVLPLLAKLDMELEALGEHHWVHIKREEVRQLVQACAGLWLEAICEVHSTTPGESVNVDIGIYNRSGHPIEVKRVKPPYAEEILAQSIFEDPGKQYLSAKHVVTLSHDIDFSHPYWLREAHDLGRFTIPNQLQIGQPEVAHLEPLECAVDVYGRTFRFTTPLLYHWTDPVRGELFRNLEVAPAVAVEFDEPMIAFGSDSPREIRLRLVSGRTDISGNVTLNVPAGWRADRMEFPFTFEAQGEEAIHTLRITPPATPFNRKLTASVSLSPGEPARSVLRIDYDHIPLQTLTPPAETELLRIDLQKRGKQIGYVMGSGDDIPDALKQLGFEVALLSDDDLKAGDLRRYDAIITGIRAYNTRDKLKQVYHRLMDYVSGGGTMVVQYNTAHRLVTEEIGPYPIKLSRDRVTLESAPVSFVNFNHPLLQSPNEILQLDFQNWVQERGLYFPGEWDRRYQPILSCHDPGEAALEGGLLYTEYGSGVFIYTGFSFFRQLPAGVPGAYRLFVNLISARQQRG